MRAGAEDLNSNLEEVYVRPKLPLNIYRRSRARGGWYNINKARESEKEERGWQGGGM